MAAQFTVKGYVRHGKDCEPLTNIKVSVFDKDLRSEQSLGEAITDENGYYEIHYTDEHFRRADKRTADLVFRLSLAEGIPLTLTEIQTASASLPGSSVVFNAPVDAHIDLLVETLPVLSEYERLLFDLTPVLEGVDPADLTDEDLGFLLRETTDDLWRSADDQRARLEFLRGAAILARDTSLPTEAFYGFARLALPEEWKALLETPPRNPQGRTEILQTILKRLQELTRQALGDALREAIDQNIVPSTLRERIGDIVRRLSQLGFVRQTASARLVDANTNAPLASVTVRILDRDAAAEPEEIGREITDSQGQFTLSYLLPNDAPQDAQRRLQPIVQDRDAKEIAKTDLTVKRDQSGILTIPISIPTTPLDEAQRIDNLATAVKLEIPEALTAFLKERNIESLADIRASGGITALDGLPPSVADHASIRLLEAHADLSRLSPDIKINADLIDKGFASVAKIADTPRSEFVTAAHEQMGDFKAAQLQVMARAQTAFLNNILTGIRANHANGFPNTPEMAEIESRLDALCSCRDCEAAVSPAAYLADLLRYTLKNVRNNNQPIDRKFLEDTFHQPFGDLRSDCQAVEEQVRQVRICIEVLRSYLRQHPLSNAPTIAALAKAEKQYLIDAYTLLLNKVGTSFDEVRLARTAKADERQKLADRLGINLTVPRTDPATTKGDELDQLFLNPELDSATERSLEELLGLVDTTREPLSDGAKFGDDNPAQVQLTRWSLEGVLWNRNTDAEGKIYLRLTSPTSLARIEAFRDVGLMQLVAEGTQDTINRPVRLIPKDSSGLTGTIEVALAATNGTITISAIPKFLSWRLQRLRSFWEQQDRPEDAYAAGVSSVEFGPPGFTLPAGLQYDDANRRLRFDGVMHESVRDALLGASNDTAYREAVTRLYFESRRPPLIDPDLVGPDDFRNPVLKSNAGDADRPFDLWLSRRKFVDAKLNDLRNTRESDAANGLTNILKQTLGDPLPDLDDLTSKLNKGLDPEETKWGIRKLNLTVDAFRRLMDVREKDRQHRLPNSTTPEVLSEEWEEVYSILAQAEKLKQFATWREQEDTATIRFGLEEFWFSEHEPKEGNWPSELKTDTPLIDPDHVKAPDLPETTAGAEALTLLQRRTDQLEQIRKDLQTERERNGFNAMLLLALGHPNPGNPLQHDLDVLRRNLASSDTNIANPARAAIEQDLHMSVEAFGRLMTIRGKDANTDPTKKPSDAEYNEIITILTRAQKEKRLFSSWANDEQTVATNELQQPPIVTGIDRAYWRFNKAMLPKWRANAEARSIWRQVLRARTQRPLIDPDLIGLEDLRDPLAGPAFVLWRNRNTELKNQRDDLDSLRQSGGNNTPLQGFEAIITNAALGLGITAQAFVDIDTRRKAGFSIASRLEQLNLSNAGFNHLIRLRELAEKTQPILDTEWESAYSILIQAQKQRRFAEWREQERRESILLSPDHFKIPEPPEITVPPIPPRQLNPFRASLADLLDWRDTLQSRIDQEGTVLAGMHDAVGAAEEARLPQLRDALIEAVATAVQGFDAKVKWVTRRFLIDAKVSGCQKTTRVSQAIETLQSLLFSLRTGQFNPDIELEEAVAAVSWDANRIDLFARSPGNVLVHRFRDGNLNWSDWEALEGEITSRPAAASRGPNRLDVFARLPDNTLGHRQFENGQWTPWESFGKPAESTLTSAPAAVGGPNERLDVLVRGEKNVLYWWSRDATQQAKWEALTDGDSVGRLRGGVFDEPAISSPNPGQLDAVVRAFGRIGIGGPNMPIRKGLWHRTFSNGVWASGWRFVENSSNLNAAPAIVSNRVNPIDLSCRGNDNSLQNFVFDGGWKGPFSMGGILISAPALSSRGAGTLDVFVQGTDKQVWTRSFDNNAWSGWKRASSLVLGVVAENFDEEWKWMGSYATWRAAMFVFLYPENILHPSLKLPKSSNFESIVKETRINRNLKPKDVCKKAIEYSNYFKDVCSLSIDATCQANTRVRHSDGCSAAVSGLHTLFYLFAKSSSGNLYWSAYNPHDNTELSQKFWERVHGFEDVAVLQIIGAVPYPEPVDRTDTPLTRTIATNNRVRFIYLFCIIRKNGEEALKLVFSKFDLERFGESDAWTKPYKELQSPPFGFEVVSVQTRDGKRPPQLVFHPRGTGDVYARALNLQGEDWEGNQGDWESFRLNASLNAGNDGNPIPFDKLHACLRTGSSQWFCFSDNNKDLTVKVFGEKIQGKSRSQSWTLPESSFIGAIPSTQSMGFSPIFGFVLRSAIYVFFVNQDQQPVYQLFEDEHPKKTNLSHLAFSDLIKIPPNSGYPPASLNYMALQRGSFFMRSAYDERGTELIKFSPEFAAPRIDVPHDIPLHLAAPLLQNRRQSIVNTFFENIGQPISTVVHIPEPYYFVPLHLAMQLQAAGYFVEALDLYRTIYDYQAPITERKIYYGLVLDENTDVQFTRGDEWLLDPLNPHRIASNRRLAYTRFTVMAIVRCLLDYADAEFTRETPESVAKARILYSTALELLDLPEFKQELDSCPKKIGDFVSEIAGDAPDSVLPILNSEIGSNLLELNDARGLTSTAAVVKEALASSEDFFSGLREARTRIKESIALAEGQPSIAEVMERQATFQETIRPQLLTQQAVSQAVAEVARNGGNDFLHGVSFVSGISPSELETDNVALPWLRANPLASSMENNGLTAIPVVEPLSVSPLTGLSRIVPNTALPLALNTSDGPIGEPLIAYCIPPNPIIKALRLRAELNLHKLRTCRNIAGLKRELEPYAAATDTTTGLPTVGSGGQLVLPGVSTIRPTLYRYPVLIERAKQLVQIAAQIEGQMLTAIERRDAAHYELLKARQELGLAEAGVRLQDLRLIKEKGSVSLADLQVQRAQTQIDTFEDFLQKGLNEFEDAMIIAYREAAAAEKGAAVASGRLQQAALIKDTINAGIQFATADIKAKGAVGTLASSIAAINAYAFFVLVEGQIEDNKKGIDQTLSANIARINADQKRREDEWTLQKSLAEQDKRIGAQEKQIAEDSVDVVTQEKSIAQLQVTNAKEGVEYLTNKFTNEELYDWMSDVLEGVYHFFIQQATSTAKLAENQLAFERQEPPPAFIQADYWNLSAQEGTTDSQAQDRRGLTGSVRLLQDIFQLDQYAFLNNQRKLQLVKLLSLSKLVPFEFQQFRETGLITFATPMELFDRDFPGHYLRLIKRVRTTVIALVPTTQGIHATLSTIGVSRVVIGPEVFQTVPIRRPPEFVALSSPVNSTGVFELEAQTDMLLPFEGNGVDSRWEFRMPKPANLFDYRTIADVLITIEYTALDSADYRAQVIQTLKPTLSANRPFSFRNQFPDQWFDLHNPDQTSTPMIVRFRTVREDFPPNLDGIKIQQVVMYFARTEGKSFEIPVTHLRYTEQGSAGSVGGAADSIDGVISTLRGNASSWLAIQGKSPAGEWELALPNTDEIRNRFKNEDIEDILLVITYAGRTPPWPS